LIKLLAQFDADSERAGEKYEHIRSALVKFFECRGCSLPYDLTDETINRVARKVLQGAEIYPNALSGYFYGVARNVFREYLRSPESNTSAIDLLPASEQPYETPVQLEQNRYERVELERQLECLKTCLDNLPPETRKLIVSYYEGEERTKIDNRKRIAETLGISLSTLRIRAFRIKQKLEGCVSKCLKDSEIG
jgi:RNA polymerase sigma factor (sigma-70 family)